MTPDSDAIAKMWLSKWTEKRAEIEAWREKRRAELNSYADEMNRQDGGMVSFHDLPMHYVAVLLGVLDYERARADADVTALRAEIDRLRKVDVAALVRELREE